MKDIRVSFPGGKRVDAQYDGFTVHTDQSVAHGGEASAPEPFDLFFVSLATCVGIYALEFCNTRGLHTDGLGVRLQSERDEAQKRYADIRITITLPAGFPEKYRPAIVRAADLCTVKRHILTPPAFTIELADS
jgi:uncharacterized OsmC-like protein